MITNINYTFYKIMIERACEAQEIIITNKNEAFEIADRLRFFFRDCSIHLFGILEEHKTSFLKHDDMFGRKEYDETILKYDELEF